MKGPMKPRMFIASSVEGLPIAYAIQENLEHDAEVTVWNQSVFELSSITIDGLREAARSSNFGAFVLSPDDELKLRGSDFKAARDNVIMELGVFIGILGRERCFVVHPRTPTLHLPTDVLGLTPATFDGSRQDGNLAAALGPACNKIREAIKKGSSPGTRPTVLPQIASTPSESDVRLSLRSWLLARHDHIGVAINYQEVDSELSLPPGSAKASLRDVGQSLGYVLQMASERQILFSPGPSARRPGT